MEKEDEREVEIYKVVVATQFHHCLFVFGVAQQLRAWRHGGGGRKDV